jgi:hypothetical protein
MALWVPSLFYYGSWFLWAIAAGAATLPQVLAIWLHTVALVIAWDS